MASKKIIKIFNSLAEAREEEVKYVVSQKPVDRIKETVQLILRVYPLNRKAKNTNRIYFDKT